jgi:hypothetical protein
MIFFTLETWRMMAPMITLNNLPLNARKLNSNAAS